MKTMGWATQFLQDNHVFEVLPLPAMKSTYIHDYPIEAKMAFKDHIMFAYDMHRHGYVQDEATGEWCGVPEKYIPLYGGGIDD